MKRQISVAVDPEVVYARTLLDVGSESLVGTGLRNGEGVR